MQANLTTFAAISVGALLAFFPIFNQVRDTSLEALTEAKAKANLKNVPDQFKKNLPDDEKVDYYDGRAKPEDFGGEIDEDRIDNDGKYKGSDEWKWEDPEDAKKAEEEGEENVTFHYEERREFVFVFNATDSDQGVSETRTVGGTQDTYERFFQACTIREFYGTYRFVIEDTGEAELDSFDSQGGGTPVALGQSRTNDCGSRSEFLPDDDLAAVAIDYQPTAGLPPTVFEYTIEGVYHVKVMDE